MSKVTNIGSRLHSVEQGNVLTGANEILDDTKGKKQNVINSETDAELLRLENEKQNILTFDNIPIEGSNNPVKSDGVYAADKALSDAIEAILLLIPSAASALNKLADKSFVNSSVQTATASFKGTFNLISDLELSVSATHAQIEAALGEAISDADNNDYAYVQVPVSDDEPTEIAKTERYKFNGTVWAFEYELNTSGFTAVQWAAINSGITALLVSKLTDLPTAAVLANMFDAKQNTLNWDAEPTALSTNPVTSGGIYTAIKAVADALTNYENNINALIPSEATDTNQLADKAYVLAQIIAGVPSFKGQFTTLTELQAVASPKAGDLGIVRTKDNDGLDVFTFYQYKENQWNVFFELSYHPITKPATTGIFGNYPFNGMGKIELPMNIVEGAWTDNTWIYYPINDVVYLLYSWHLQLYAVYNIGTQEGLGLDDNLVVKDANYNINDIAEIVGERYLTFTEAGGVFTITKPDTTTITSTELNNTTIYNYNDPSHEGVNVLTQAMLTQQNTIYVIQYDFTLGEDINVPANCVLEFDGGSIIGEHTITGQNTHIIANSVKIFNIDLTLSGNWIATKTYFEWFGAKGDGTTNDTNAILKTINSFCISGLIIQLLNKTYLTDRLVISNCGNLQLIGDDFNLSTFKLNSNNSNILQINGGTSLFVEKIIFDGNNKEMASGGGGLLQTNNISNHVLRDCTFKNFVGTSSNGIAGGGYWVVDECKFIQLGSGPYITSGKITNCLIQNCNWGIQAYVSNQFIITNNNFLNNVGDIIINNPYQMDFHTMVISNNTFVGTNGNDRPSISISNSNPVTTKDQSIVINSNVFDINTSVFSFGSLSSDYTCNNVIISNNIVRKCTNIGTIHSANNVLMVNNIVENSLNCRILLIYGALKDFIIDGLLCNSSANDTGSNGVLGIQGHYQPDNWKIDNFTIKNFKITGLTSGSFFIWYYPEKMFSDDSVINIENDRNSLSYNPSYFTADLLYNKIYFKYIPSYLDSGLARYGVKKDFGIGKLICQGNTLYYWNGSQHKNL